MSDLNTWFEVFLEYYYDLGSGYRRIIDKMHFVLGKYTLCNDILMDQMIRMVSIKKF